MAPPGQNGAETRAEHHRYQREQGVETTPYDEGDHPVRAEVGRVDGGTDMTQPYQLEGRCEHDRGLRAGTQRERMVNPAAIPTAALTTIVVSAAVVVSGPRGVHQPARRAHAAASATAATAPAGWEW